MLFNLVEGLDGRAEEEPRIAGLLAATGRPMTGCRPRTLALCRRKDRLNAALAGRGLPVPAWTVVRPGEPPDWSVFPAIVKPRDEDGSVGIDGDAVVEDLIELAAALGRAAGPMLVQRFVGGREFAVGVVGATPLPVSEIRFAGAARVLSYAAKWDPGSTDDRATRPVCPARLTDGEASRLRELALRAWAAAEGRGYGRIDLRTDEAGEPYVLEVNPNPDLAPGAGLARMARAAGWSYDDLVERILREARP